MKRLLLLAGIAAVVGFAASAHADTDGTGNDAVFLNALSAAGLSYRGPEQAVSAGKAVCHLMDAGFSPMDTVVAVQDTNPGFTTERAAQFAVISVGTYCPQHV
jgi:hypothetical protein